MRTVVRSLWLFACMGALIGSVLYRDGVASIAAEKVLSALTFPIGFVVALLGTALSKVLLLAFDIDVASRPALVVAGLFMIAAAYWQWSRLRVTVLKHDHQEWALALAIIAKCLFISAIWIGWYLNVAGLPRESETRSFVSAWNWAVMASCPGFAFLIGLVSRNRSSLVESMKVYVVATVIMAPFFNHVHDMKWSDETVPSSWIDIGVIFIGYPLRAFMSCLAFGAPLVVVALTGGWFGHLASKLLSAQRASVVNDS